MNESDPIGAAPRDDLCPCCRGPIEDYRGAGFSPAAMARTGTCFWWADGEFDEYNCNRKEAVATRELQATITDACDRAMRFIASNQEKLIEAWIAETGLKPSESMLVQTNRSDGTITYHVERRTP